jgi:cardiolipin synthase
VTAKHSAKPEIGIEPPSSSESLPVNTQVKPSDIKQAQSKSDSEVAILIKRHRALRWFAIISMLAVVSLVVISLFGPVPKYDLTSHPSLPLDSPEFVHQLAALSSARIDEHTSIQVLTNGTNFYPAELNAIHNARESVDLEAYILEKGEMAKQIVDALTERARAGVEVNVVADAMGSATTRKSMFDELKHAGGKVAWYHPMRWYNWPRANNRTHREMLIVDGKVGFIGGAGIADHWWKAQKNDAAWRDTMFQVTGSAVTSMQGIFTENWLEASDYILIGDKYFPQTGNPDGATALAIGSSPSEGGSTRARMLFQVLIGSAKSNIVITTPYFLPDDSLRKEMIRAIQERGVKVEILVPGKHSDHSMTRSSSQGLFGDLLKAGAEISEYEPAMIHAKIMVVDGLWSVVGSTNLDHRSFGLNDEDNLVVLDRELAARLLSDFHDDIAKSKRVTLQDWEHRSLWERSMEWFGWLISREQ